MTTAYSHNPLRRGVTRALYDLEKAIDAATDAGVDVRLNVERVGAAVRLSASVDGERVGNCYLDWRRFNNLDC